MAAPVIPISLDSSEESVAFHVPRVILFGNIPTSIPVIFVDPAEVPIVPADPLVAPKVGAVSVIPPTEVLDLVDYSYSESKPAEQRLERHDSLIVHDAMVLRWRDRVASRLSSPPRSSSYDILAPSSEFPLALVLAPSGIYFTSNSSFSGSSLDSSLDTSSDSLSDTSSVHCLGCDTRWRSAPFSTPYPPTTSESSLDSSSKRSLDLFSPSVGPSRKRCRSLTTLVLSSTPISRSISLTLDDLLPPRKRFKDSYSPEDSSEDHMEIGIADAEAVVDLGIGDKVGSPTEDGTCMEVKVVASNIREDEEKFEAEASAGGTMEIAIDPLVTGVISESTGGDAHDLEGTLYDIAHYMSKVPLDRITEFETAQRQLEAVQLVVSRERAGLAYRVRRLGRENLRVQALLCIKRDRVDSLCHHMALSQEEFC
nr:hypothetical protein [Tanacetum cinerariifolium]